MFDKKAARMRRSRSTRAKIAELKTVRLAVFRSNKHIYAQVIDGSGSKVLASASTVEKAVRAQGGGANSGAAVEAGKRIAERAIQAGIKKVAFDRSGYRYHGRIKALADAAREAGLDF
jgi:large subunit ribosomal protein L18